VEITYKGFFSKEEAFRERDDLSRQNKIRMSRRWLPIALSAGLNDPIFSSMIQSDPVALANLVLHEMTHATLYFRGRTDFNEQVATLSATVGPLSS